MTTVLTAWRMPSSAELADRLGVEVHSVGPLRPSLDGRDAIATVNVDRQLQRLTVVVDDRADWPSRPTQRPPPKVIVPARWRHARERAEVEASDRRRRAEVEASHFAALNRLAERVVTAAVRSGHRPAWLAAARAADAERALTASARQRPGPSAVAVAALGLAGSPPRRHLTAGACRVCSTTTTGERLCSECSGDADLMT